MRFDSVIPGAVPHQTPLLFGPETNERTSDHARFSAVFPKTRQPLVCARSYQF